MGKEALGWPLKGLWPSSGVVEMLSSSLRGLTAGRQVASKAKSLSSLFATADQSRSAHTVEEAKFEIQPFKLHLLESGPAEEATLTREDALNYYKIARTDGEIDVSEL